MTEVRTFEMYVRGRLESWGREFCLDRDCEYLGHKSKDMLQVLIEHKGEMPPRPTGFKPLEIPPLEMQIEDIVADMTRDGQRHMSAVLRSYYCGTGRKAVERLAQARYMIQQFDPDTKLSKRKYYTLHDLGFQRVVGVLQGIARAA